MKEALTRPAKRREDSGDALKSWTTIVLAMGFILLYGAALLGWLKPMADEKMVARLEPVIFIIIGYYFGRLPARHNEKTLKDEISRQTQRADAAQHAKEQAQQVREALEEKVKNVRITLAPSASGAAVKSFAANESETAAPSQSDSFWQTVATAINILNS